MKYSCYDWNGNKKADNINNLKDAVREALKLECEIHDGVNYRMTSSLNG